MSVEIEDRKNFFFFKQMEMSIVEPEWTGKNKRERK